MFDGKGTISFTPDSKFLLTGKMDGSVLIYEVESGEKIATYSGHHKPCVQVLFSPSHVMFSSAGDSVILWTPKSFDKIF